MPRVRDSLGKVETRTAYGRKLLGNTVIVVVRDVNAAIRLLFPGGEDQVQSLLEPLASDRVRWAVLALSCGDPEKLQHYLRDGLRDYRDVLMGAESCSPEFKGPIVRALPASEELSFRFLQQELEGLGFFDRLVQAGALVFDPPQDSVAVASALTQRLARGFGPANWLEVPMDTARFLLLHVMKRSFTEAEIARAQNLLEEFVSFAPVERSLISGLPEELPIESDGRPHRGSGPRNYTVGGASRSSTGLGTLDGARRRMKICAARLTLFVTTLKTPLDDSVDRH